LRFEFRDERIGEWESEGGKPMKQDDIKRWQARKLAEVLHPQLGYLYRLRSRMEKTGFLPSDPYYRLVEKAYDAVHALWIETHYMSCSGAGKSSIPEGEKDSNGGPGQVANGEAGGANNPLDSG
jgi:hypothetical protein